MSFFLINQKNSKGFTLVEILVSIFIFTVIMGAIMNLLVSTIQSQIAALKDQKVTSEVSYIMEYTSRALRMAKRDVDGDCIGENNNYLLVGEGGAYGSIIRFLSYNGECQEFGLNEEEGKIYERKSNDGTSAGLSSQVYLTSAEVTVEQIVFHKAGSDWHLGGDNQSKVMINMRINSKEGRNPMNMQTTVSQRNINLES